MEGGWADYVCKLIFIHVRVAHFNFQHITSGCAPEVAAALCNSDLWWLVNTSKSWTWFRRRHYMFFIAHSNTCLGACTHAAVILQSSYAERQKSISLFTEPRFEPRQADAQVKHRWSKERNTFLLLDLELPRMKATILIIFLVSGFKVQEGSKSSIRRPGEPQNHICTCA